MITGQPVLLFELFDHPVIHRLIVLSHRLNSRRIIHMRHRRDRRANVSSFSQSETVLVPPRVISRRRFFATGGHQQHVRALALQLEPVRRPLPQHGRRERPKTFPELDLQVHHLLHLWRSRIADDRSRAQCPRAEFHPPMKPADHFLRALIRSAIFSGSSSSVSSRERNRSATRDKRGSRPANSRVRDKNRVANRACRRPGVRCPASGATLTTPHPARRPHRPRPVGSKSRSKIPSRRIRPFATQLSATPPARQRFLSPVSRAEHAAPCGT